MPDRPAILRQPRVVLTLEDVRLHRFVDMLGHYDHVRADRMLAPHQHPEMLEICYLARGRQVYHVAGRDYAMRAGEIFLTFPGEQHSTGGRPQEKGELFWLQLRLRHGRFLGLAPQDAAPLIAALGRLPRRHFVASSAVGALFERLVIAAAAPSHRLKRIEVTSLLLELVLEVRRCAARREQPNTRDAALQGLLDHIHAHLAEPLSIDSLARQLGISASWFKSRFRAAMGVPPAEYVQRARIERAQHLLRQGLSVTQVAMQLGFSSSQYFATVYRRYTDEAPTARRRKGFDT